MAATYGLLDIIQQVRDTINEPVARVFNDLAAETGQIGYFVDMGAVVCSSLTLCKQASESETCAGDDYEYTPTTEEFIKIDSVTYSPNANNQEYGLQKIRPEAYGNVVAITAGIPKYYFTHNNGKYYQVYVLPAPTSAMASATDQIIIRGAALVAGFGTAASETLPDSLQYVPYYYALSCCYARLGKHRLSALNMQKFIQECNQWRIDVHGAVGRVDSHDMTRIPDITVSVS